MTWAWGASASRVSAGPPRAAASGFLRARPTRVPAPQSPAGGTAGVGVPLPPPLPRARCPEAAALPTGRTVPQPRQSFPERSGARCGAGGHLPCCGEEPCPAPAPRPAPHRSRRLGTDGARRGAGLGWAGLAAGSQSSLRPFIPASPKRIRFDVQPGFLWVWSEPVQPSLGDTPLSKSYIFYITSFPAWLFSPLPPSPCRGASPTPPTPSPIKELTDTPRPPLVAGSSASPPAGLTQPAPGEWGALPAPGGIGAAERSPGPCPALLQPPHSCSQAGCAAENPALLPAARARSVPRADTSIPSGAPGAPGPAPGGAGTFPSLSCRSCPWAAHGAGNKDLLTPFPLLTLHLPPARPRADPGLTSVCSLCDCAHSHGNNKHTIIDI